MSHTLIFEAGPLIALLDPYLETFKKSQSAINGWLDNDSTPEVSSQDILSYIMTSVLKDSYPDNSTLLTSKDDIVTELFGNEVISSVGKEISIYISQWVSLNCFPNVTYKKITVVSDMLLVEHTVNG